MRADIHDLEAFSECLAARYEVTAERIRAFGEGAQYIEKLLQRLGYVYNEELRLWQMPGYSERGVPL